MGKTTTSVNLSASLSAAEKKTLLVDMDPQGNAGSGVGVDKRAVTQSVYDVLLGELSIESVIKNTELSHLHILPSNLDLVGAELELSGAVSRESRLISALTPILSNYDYIIIDCPPSLGLLTLNALNASHGVITPVQCEYYALEGIADLMSTVELVKTSLNPRLQVLGVLLTMYDGRNNLSKQVAEEIRFHFGVQVFQSIVPRNVRLSEAPSHGRPIILYDIKSIGAIKYLEFAQEVMARTPLLLEVPAKEKAYGFAATATQGVGQGIGIAHSVTTASGDDTGEG